jgi:F0F1-type ATP synthase assembly protein I
MPDEPESSPDAERAIEERVRQAQAEIAGIDDEFHDRLRQLEARAEAAQGGYKKKEAEKDRVRKSDGESSRGLGVGLSVAYTILGMPMVGAAIGWFVDKQTGMKIFLGLGTVGGAVLGVVFALVILSRHQDK